MVCSVCFSKKKIIKSKNRERTSACSPCIKNTCQDYVCITCEQVYILTDISDSVHPAPHPHFIPDIWGVTELMDNCDVIWVGTTEQLSLQGQ